MTQCVSSSGENAISRLTRVESGRCECLVLLYVALCHLSYSEKLTTSEDGFDEHPAHLPQGAISRAAALIRAAGQYREQLRSGTLPPEATKAGPICMDTYRWMFDCSRIPGLEGADWSISHAHQNPSHIVVLRKGRVWKLDVWHEGKLLSVADLEKYVCPYCRGCCALIMLHRQLQFIYDNTSNDYPGVGVLTASNRDVWAKVRYYAYLRPSAHPPLRITPS